MPNIGSAPRGLNHEVGLLAQSSTGVRTDPVVELYADPTTHRLLVDAGSITTTSLSDGATAAAVPADASYIGGNKAGNLVGLLIGQQTMANSLAIVLASDQAAIPVTGTFWQATQPVSGTVTANAGTNLNTSALALEAGNLLAVKNSVANIPALGQALAAASVPVVLTAAQLITLTPPAAITGYALDSSLTTINTSLTDVATLGAKTDAKSTATDATSVTIMQVLKEISAMEQAPPSRAVTNAGTFAVQATPVTQVDTFMLGGVNIKEINAITPLMGNGVTGTGSLRVTIASDNTAFAVNSTLSAETTKVIGTVNIASSQTIALAAGSQVIGHVINDASTAVIGHVIVDSGTVTTVSAVTAITNALPAGTNNIGLVTPTPTANKGWSFSYQSALSSTKAEIKSTAGTFGGYINLFNPNTATTFIQVFNKAAANVTVGTTAPDFVITLPGVATASGTGSDRNLEITCGLAMSTGITIAATTTATGLTGPSNAIVGTFLFI